MDTATPAKAKDAYRNYETPGRDTVREFYRLNHAHQTHDFVLSKKADFLRFNRRAMTPWEALDYLNTLVDDSDPDIALPQIDHLLQTAEAIRADGHPDWMVLTGLIHDLGKVLCLFGEPQWAVVGDTFPTGCPYSSRIVYSEFFALNPDYDRAEFATTLRQNILVARRTLAIAPPLHQSRLDEGTQATCEHVRGDAETFLELIEARESVECIANDQDAPPLADTFQRPGDGALHLAEASAFHGRNIGR